MRRRRRNAALVAAACFVSCAPGPNQRPPGNAHSRPSGSADAGAGSTSAHCDYEVHAVHPAALLDVDVRCVNFRAEAWRTTRELAPFTSSVRSEAGDARTGSNGHFAFATALSSFTYRVDLDRAARELEDFDLALAVGGSVLAPASSFLMRPDPAPANVAVAVHVRSEEPSMFATGLERAGDGYVLSAHELWAATYSVFGKFESEVLRLPKVVSGESEVDVVWLDGATRSSKSDRSQWVGKAVHGVADFYGGFPAPHTLVALAPIPGRSEVLHGKLLPAGGDAIAVLVGEGATRRELDDDWILIHELFHLGFPSFVGEGAWLDEGLATYVEPLIRARAGLLTEAATWREITAGMERGRRLCETTGLEHYGEDFRAVYWGGAIASLLADVEARKRTGGARGLEDGLRSLLSRGGDARKVWRVDDAIRTIDDAIGSPVLAELAARYRFHGSPVPLEQVLTELGVVRTPRGVDLHDDAPLAGIRRGITWGAAGAAKRTAATTGAN